MAPPLDLALESLSAARPPVLLLGGINLLRALGAAGIPTIVCTGQRDEPALHSRYCTAWLPLPRLDGPAAVDALVDAGRRLADRCGGRVPLFFGSDEALELVSAHRERLSRFFLLALPDRTVSEALVAKDCFQAFAESRGLPVPRALAFEGEGPGTLRGTPMPVVVKPRHKADWHHSALCHHVFDGDAKALAYPSGAAAAEDARLALHASELIFQEQVPGGDDCLWSYHGFADERGEVLAGFVGRKIRTFPVDNGESAFIEVADSTELEMLGQGIARRCPLHGFFKMDFKRDPRDGRWVLLEINARASLWHYVGAANGVNLMKVARDFLVDGMAPVPRRAATTYRWINLSLDTRAARQLRDRGDLSLPGWLLSLASLHHVYGLFAWRDPMPWVLHWARRVTGRLARPSARLLSLLRPWRPTAS